MKKSQKHLKKVVNPPFRHLTGGGFSENPLWMIIQEQNDLTKLRGFNYHSRGKKLTHFENIDFFEFLSISNASPKVPNGEVAADDFVADS